MLITAARNREAWALEALYRGYSARVHVLCFRILGSSADAEDAMQSTFVQAFRQLPGFRSECDVKTWLYRIASNEALMMLRRRGRTVSAEAIPELSQSGGEAAAADSRILVHLSLSKLNEDQRLILILHYWEELTCDEIAGVLSVSVPCVKMRLSRARTAFRKHFGEDL